MVRKTPLGSPCRCDEATVVLGVGARLGVADHADGVLLRLDAGRHEVAVAHVVAVIDAESRHTAR